MDRVLINKGEFSLSVVPGLGGSVASFQFQGVDIFNPMPDTLGVLAWDASSYPLVPFSNRIKNGKFTFDGRDIELSAHDDDQPHPIHGVGWLRAWDVTAQTPQSVTLEFEHQPMGDAAKLWPWAFKATQTFELVESGLVSRISCENLSTTMMPVGLGLHPYFARASECLVHWQAEEVQVNDENMVPVGLEPISEKWNYSTPKKPLPDTVDNCFAGWSGVAEVLWPDQDLKAVLTSPTATNMIMYTPPADRDYVALEPVSHVNNAINDFSVDGSGKAMSALEPGQTQTMEMHVSVHRI